MLNDETKTKIFNRVVELIQKSNQIWNRNFDIPNIYYDVRGTRGGYQKGNEIHFNPSLLIENLEHFIHQTVGHEFAHYIQKVLHPFSKPHGYEWKVVMYKLGLKPDRCHK